MLEGLDTKSKRVGIGCALALFGALPAHAYEGTISAAGYTPPGYAVVYWRTFSGGDIPRRLNPAAPWSGSNSDRAGYLARYAEGKDDILGRWIASQGVETQGGMSYLILQALFREKGIGRDPDPREVLDFGIANGVTRQLGCADFARLVGRPDPGCRDAPAGGAGKIRPQPTTPPGCCKRALPCVVADGRVPGTVWQEPVQTPQGGRIGCFLIEPARAAPPDPPGGGSSPGTDPPAGGGQNEGSGTPPATRSCFLLVIEGGSAALSPLATCPPPP